MMTVHMIAAITAHPIATTFVVLLVGSFLAVVYLLAYHGSGPQLDQRGHNGPYRPPFADGIHAPYDLSKPICIGGNHVLFGENATCMCGARTRWQFEHPFESELPRDLQLRAKDAVAEYREKTAIAGRPLKGRRT